jgi:hypothetical protein
MVSKNQWHIIKIVEAVPENIANLFWGHIWRYPICGARTFICIGHRPMTERLLNTEYEQNPSKCSGANEAQIHTYIQTDGITKRISYSVGFKTSIPVKISRQISFTITVISHLYCVYEKVKIMWQLRKCNTDKNISFLKVQVNTGENKTN